ncbi:MAG: aminopeptidase P family protein [Deltaproteobacteria bacterium]|nr:aminopeptidase P family protein [Deltaproteobacteria bacterium]
MSDENVKLKKIIEHIKQRGLDGVIIYSSGTCNVLRASYLYYFSDFKPLGPRNAAVISTSGDVTLLVQPQWDALRATEKSWIGDIRGTSDFAKDLTGILREQNIAGSVGIIGAREMNYDVYGTIQGQAAIELTDDIIEEMAKEKTPREIEIIKKVAKIADIGFQAFFDHARVGIREYELNAEMEFAMRSAGAHDIFVLMSSGKNNYEMHEPTDRRLSEGDIVIAEFSPNYEGQFIQLCRTVVLGEPSPVLYEKYDMLMHAFHEALKVIKPGVPASEISKAMNKVIGDAGYAKYCYPPYMRARGHGFGVGSVAPGAGLNDDTKLNIEKDQVIVPHPNQWLPETGYLACGDSVLVTDTGYEILTEIEMKLFVKEV